MAGEIATAFVRIRPNMEGFKSETESGVRHAFSGLAEIVAGVFAGKQAFDFGKALIGDAASFQKQVEVINAQFGKAAEGVKRFGDVGAQKLGISAQTADTVSAKFGILFKNLGIGQKAAAGMTVGWEKLAGALSAIKGVDPAEALQATVFAAAGNTRGLKQLGISIDQNQIKLAAWKLGLISSVKDGITPAIRAQAIYALATANLGAFQAQAKKHAGDLANVQKRLSAAWSNAKGIIGDALLPIFAKYARELEKWLTRMEKSGKLQKDFNLIVGKAKSIIKGVGDTVRTSWHVFVTVTGWLGGTKQAVVDLLAVLVVSKFAAIAAGMVNSMVNNGTKVLAREFQVAEGEVVASFSGMELAAVGFSATLKAALISTGIGALVVGIGIAAAEIIQHWSTVKRWLAEFGRWIEGHAKALFFVPIIGPFILVTVEIIKHFGTIKATVLAFVHFFATVFTHPIRAVEGLFRDMKGVVVGIFHGLEREALKTALAIVEPFSHLPGFLGGGQFQGIKKWLQNQLAGLDGTAKNAADKTAGIFGKTLTDGLKKKAKSPFGTPNASIDTAAADAAIKNGSAWGKHVVKGVVDTVKAAAPVVTKAMREATAQAIAESQKRIADSVLAAKTNLDDLGQKLSDSVNKILDKMGGAGNLIAGSPQATAFKKLRDIIAGGGGTVEIERASQQLSAELQAKASAAGGDAARRERVKRQFADLTGEFNKHQISLQTFNKRVASLLAKNHVSFKSAGKLLGSAFADGFRGQLHGLHEQAAAIAALPARLRNLGGAGGAADPKIIRPLEVIRRENQRLALRAEKQRERMIKATERAAKAAEKNAALAAEAAHTKVGTLPGHTSKKARSAAQAGIQP